MNNLGCQKACELFPEWEACNADTGHTGYKAGDGALSYCVDGKAMIGESVTTDDNCDTPQAGALLNPPTWNIWTLESYIDKAAAEAVGNAGGDGVVTQGSFAGETLTLQRSVGADITIPGFAQVQNLQDCNGDLLSVGSQVASCAQVTTLGANQATLAQTQADQLDLINDKQDQLQDTAGTDLVADQHVVAESNLSTSDFTVDPATGVVSVNTKDLCIVTEVNTDPCATYSPLYTTVGADGCARLISSDNLRLDIARVRANRADITGNSVVKMPQNPTDTTTFYTLTDLNADIAAGTVDTAKLESTQIMTHDIDIPCDETYILRIENLTEFDPPMAGKSTYIIRIDGVWIPASGGSVNPRNIGNFTSFSGGESTSVAQALTGGTHTFEMFVVGHNGSGNAAQVAVRTNATGSPILDIERRST